MGRTMTALLITGSAFLLFACGGGRQPETAETETLITQQSDTLVIINSKEGVKSYRFSTPLMERYELAKEPYMEFRHGIEIETFKDSTAMTESTLRADYAIFWERRELWEAKGNVVAVNAQGQILETQQLFWNQRTHKIYSNVDTKVTQGSDIIIGVGFEADESFENFTFRRPRGTVTVDTDPVESAADSLPPGDPKPAGPGK